MKGAVIKVNVNLLTSVSVAFRHPRTVCRHYRPDGACGEAQEELCGSKIDSRLLCHCWSGHSSRGRWPPASTEKRGGWYDVPEAGVWRHGMGGRNVQRPRGVLLGLGIGHDDGQYRGVTEQRFGCAVLDVLDLETAANVQYMSSRCMFVFEVNV